MTAVSHDLDVMMELSVEQATMRMLPVVPPFDLARTVAPVAWARGCWPNVDWRAGTLTWVGWEAGRIVWRSVQQRGDALLQLAGSADAALDATWAARVLGVDAVMPEFAAEPLRVLASANRGMKPWASGSLYEGVVSSLVGQSISVAAAAVTERRLYAQFAEGIVLGDRTYWPPPLANQLAVADVGVVRASGVTTQRAAALVEVGRLFAKSERTEAELEGDSATARAKLLEISGIGPWTVRSAYLWGVGDPDAHPSGDVALLRAVRRRLPEVTTLKDLDQAASEWAPHRGWAARLFWLDLLGFVGESAPGP